MELIKIKYICIFVILAFIGGCIYGYGYDAGLNKYKEEQSKIQTETLQTERDNRSKQDNFVLEYVKQLDSYRSNINEDNVIVNTIPVPVSVCNRTETKRSAGKLSTTNKTESDITCYTTTELQNKIKQSLDIAEECDEQIIRCNQLVEACK